LAAFISFRITKLKSVEKIQTNHTRLTAPRNSFPGFRKKIKLANI
jgi:hypothetical protein